MKAFQRFCVPVLLLSLVLTGCKDDKQSSTEKEKVYDVKAKVVAVDKDKKTVTLDHEDIPGLMKAMTMSFGVEDVKVLEGIKPGDQIHGKLKVKGDANVITELHKR